MSQSYVRTVEKKDGINLIRAAVERGLTFFDTAEVYGPFINEELVSEALAPKLHRLLHTESVPFWFRLCQAISSIT